METTVVERIYLIGPSGGGKTTIAEKVAAMLGWLCVDTDRLVEEASGRTIPAIFAQDQEAGFRRLESQALERAAQMKRAVIATGAGSCESAENLARMRASGWLVTLMVTPETAYRRIGAQSPAPGDTGDTSEAEPNIARARPMLAGGHPLERLRLLAQRRSRFYREADQTVQTDDLTPDTVAARVVSGLVGRGLISPKKAASWNRRVQISQEPSYDTLVAWGALARLPSLLHNLGVPARLHVVSDQNVAAFYEPALMSSLMRAGFQPLLYQAPPGESSKSLPQLTAIVDWLAERRAERGEALLAFGGGVVGDLAGFAAAIYLRGIPLIQIPTSLLAQVDASIGGKVGINHRLGKNLLGAFYQPRLVLADPALLLTLPGRELSEGWAEVVKHGVALDADYFETLEREVAQLLAKKPEPLTRVIARSVALKASVIEEDELERDGGRRHLLNYGHTIGHAIESVAGFGRWLHGEAVAAGMMAEAQLGLHLGVTPAEVVIRQRALLERYGLPTSLRGLPASELLRACLWDKKVKDGRRRWVLPSSLGKAALFDHVDDADILKALIDVGAGG
jgi:shikimate kinase / 3-dehydroquinate synthase